MKAKIKVVLVDDEESSRIVFRNLLSDFFPETEVTGEAESVEEAYELINKLKPQLVFLDIQMPKASGLTLLKKYDTIPFDVIFVTSFDKYAINAIKFSALDYLLKPVEISDLKNALEKAIRHIEQRVNSNSQIINLVHSFDSDYDERKIAVHSGEKVKMLSEHQIVYIEADGRYCKVVMSDNEVFMTAKYLKDFEDYLSVRPCFVRISQSLIINVKFVKEYSKGDSFIIEMQNGTSFDVPRRKKADVLKKIKESSK